MRRDAPGASLTCRRLHAATPAACSSGSRSTAPQRPRQWLETQTGSSGLGVTFALPRSVEITSGLQLTTTGQGVLLSRNTPQRQGDGLSASLNPLRLSVVGARRAELCCRPRPVACKSLSWTSRSSHTLPTPARARVDSRGRRSCAADCPTRSNAFTFAHSEVAACNSPCVSALASLVARGRPTRPPQMRAFARRARRTSRPLSWQRTLRLASLPCAPSSSAASSTPTSCRRKTRTPASGRAVPTSGEVRELWMKR